MCCTRSVYSWDVVVQRVGKKLFFDKRDNSDFGESDKHEQDPHIPPFRKPASAAKLTILSLKLGLPPLETFHCRGAQNFHVDRPNQLSWNLAKGNALKPKIWITVYHEKTF